MAKQDRKRINRAIALAASLVLAVGLVPVPAIAVGTGDELGGLASEASPEAAALDAVPLTQGDEGTASDEQPAKAERADDNGSETGAVASGDGKDDSGADSADSDGAAAADSDGDKGQPSDEAEQTDDDEASAKSASSDKDKDKNEGKDAKSESPAFAQSATVDGVTVAVEADAGVFPEGARLSVVSVPSSATEAAVDPERNADVNVAASYTFDIKVLDANGKEIQPADGKSVRVSFKAPEVADPNLDVSVYHVSDGAAVAEELGVDVSGTTATAESDGFSCYTVEFTYGDLQYVLQGGKKVALADVLSAVGLVGEVATVEVSDPELFSASEEEGAWVVSSHQAFSSEEWMRVTIGGRAYEIKVTDDNPTSGECGENLTWAIDDDGVVTISGTGPMRDYGVQEGLRSPWFENGAVKAVVIEGGVGSVGEYAFSGCLALENVTAKGDLGKIENSAFSGSGLKSATFLGGVGSVWEGAFGNCDNLSSVTFQGDVGSVGEGAFADCDNLSSVTFQGGLGSVGELAFAGCANLSSVTIPGTVTAIGSKAFLETPDSFRLRYGGTLKKWWQQGLDKCDLPSERVNFMQYDVDASASPAQGGSVKGLGAYSESEAHVLTAVPAEGYHLASWTEDGTVVSTDNPYSFTATADRTLVANFESNDATYTITASANNADGGTVSGGGTFTYGTTATLTATPSEGYVFECWTVDGDKTQKTSDSELKVKVDGNHAYKAYFWKVSIGDIADQRYTGSQIKPTGPNVQLDAVDVALVEDDYTLSYGENVNSGKGAGTVTVTFVKNFSGSATATFNITPADLSTATVEVASQVYDGTALEPAPTITWNGKQVEADDYTATYANNMRAGTATVTVTGKRNFTESSKANGTFEITARPVTITADSAQRAYDGKPLTADGFTSEGLAEGDRVASAKVEGSQTAAGSSANKVSGAKIVNAAGEDVTDCYDITYKDGTLTVKPGEKGSYEAASGSGSTWTKGSTDPVTLTFKRAADDERTFDLFKGVEVDGKAVPEKDASGKANWTAKKGSLILSLQPSYLETLSTGKHTVTAVFDDGSASATFTVEAKASPTPASGTTKGTSTSASPKTGDETGGTVVVLSVTAGAALCLALFALSQRKRRKPAHAGKHARR